MGPATLQAIIDSNLYYMQKELKNFKRSDCNIFIFITTIHKYEKAKKEKERKERAYLKQSEFDFDDDEDYKTESNPKQEGQDEDGNDDETTAKILKKYVDPITLDLIKYFFSFSFISNNVICQSE